jgi:hypothetical protein
MAITGISSISRLTSATARRIMDAVPNMTVKSARANKVVSWIGKNVSSPENRFILGVTALMSQPFIDLHNKNVDEDTRKVSAARTVAKIIAGTLTGVAIRYGCIKAIDAFTQIPEKLAKGAKLSRWKTLLTPSPKVLETLENLDYHKSALGTLISLGIMVFTNFFIDAPLTKLLTNKFVDKIHKKDNEKQTQAKLPEKKEVNNVV